MGVYNRQMKTLIKKKAARRLKIIAGQIQGLQKMIEKEDYCMDILTQSLAIQKSLGSLNKLILENHLRTHIQEKFVSNNKRVKQEAIAELLDLYELSNLRGK